MLELLAAPKKRARELLGAVAGIGDIEVFGERLHVALPGVVRDDASSVALDLAERLTAHGVVVESFRAILPTLEDIFIARVRESER